jgi:RHS repeat-associated protein
MRACVVTTRKSAIRDGKDYQFHRWYSPGVGRYTRPDPLKITGGANLWLYDPNTYLYAWANPIVVTDPLGLYGTNECSYYDQRCDECGGDYYCRLAPLACNTFPMYPDPDPNTDNDFEGWARCTRQCLQECDANNFEDRKECESDPCAGTGSFFDESHQVCHRVCYSFCHFWGTWGGGEPGMQPVFK